MIQMASFMGFLRTLLIILLIYYGVKILTRLLAPYLMRYMSKKMQQQFGGHYQNHRDVERNHPKEGETVIHKMPKTENSSDEKVGEYIDYEEIE